MIAGLNGEPMAQSVIHWKCPHSNANTRLRWGDRAFSAMCVVMETDVTGAVAGPQPGLRREELTDPFIALPLRTATKKATMSRLTAAS